MQSLDVQDYIPEVQAEIAKENQVVPTLRAVFFPLVRIEPATSSYGRWVVKYSPIHFRFFWTKTPAQNYALAWNVVQGSVKL